MARIAPVALSTTIVKTRLAGAELANRGSVRAVAAAAAVTKSALRDRWDLFFFMLNRL